VSDPSNRDRLRAIAVEAMRARGLDPDFPPDALRQAEALAAPPRVTEEPTRDLRAALWCSIDNDESRDLDQLSVAMPLPDGAVRVLVAIADVDAAVSKSSPLDRHAAVNTTSVYTPAAIFPMLPEKLSTDLTSLAEHEDRLAIVVELTAEADGSVARSDVYGGLVNNRARLTYNAVDAWLEGGGAAPPAVAEIAGMDAQLKLQDRVAALLGVVRHEQGALEFATVDAAPVFDGDTLRDLRAETPNRAKALIENLMIAANTVCARFLEAHGFPLIRRVVRVPARWDRIVAVAAETGDRLPALADSRALADFLARQRERDPDRFPDLSQTIIKLLGSGEYVVDRSGAGDPTGHFGLAVRDYTHSTAPNRRYPDLVTQRLMKAALAGHPPPYALDELDQIAEHCTQQEDAAAKVERQVRKSAAALVMASRVGARYDAIVTGASKKGTFVRISTPPVEGMLVRGEEGLDVGDRVRVRLQRVDVDRGFIDFVRG
jgi:exoribonuclease-2